MVHDEDDFGSQLSHADSWLDRVFDPSEDDPDGTDEDNEEQEEADGDDE